MNVDGQELVHLAKRRRLDADHDGSEVVYALPPYLTLATVHIPVHLASDLDVKVGEPDDHHGQRVVVSSITSSGSQHQIRIDAKWLRHGQSIEAVCSGHSLQVLNDCVNLDSITKVIKKPTKILLTCYDAILQHQSSMPTLSLKILWHDTSLCRDKVSSRDREILMRYTQDQTVPRPHSWDVQEFYQNVHVPDISDESNADLKIDLLHCKLYPFQRRAVRWLLSREGVEVLPSGHVIRRGIGDQEAVMLRGFRERKDADGGHFFANSALGVACSSRHEVETRYHGIRGGLLGEAMGLGKTVEMIAVMSLHTQATSPVSSVDGTTLRRSGASLIITPPAILEQWKQELQMHAPSLRVHHYEGMKASNRESLDTAIETLTNHDVVLTTYNVISKEFHYVMEKPDRSLRHRPRADPPKSPLDQILWWRVCLDEAQMVESGVSAAATVARLIPRVNAWAVTGTPLRQSHRDLFGLLMFLRYEPWCSSSRLWDYLVLNHRPLFRALMSEIALRHSKEIVRNELRLPPQNRHTITISFTNIEQAHYSQLFYDMYQDCGLDRYGAPENDEWDPNHPKTVEKMRMWLTRLRQTCLHPEVGGRNRRALGRGSVVGPLRTVQQVLDVMIEQNESALRAEQRNMLIARIRKGQMFENAKEKDNAMMFYRAAYNEASDFVDSCREALDAELNLQHETELKKEVEDNTDEENENEDDSQQLTTRQRLRSALEVQHICIFFIGNIFFQLKSAEESTNPASDNFSVLEKQESDAYEEAKRIRSELLAEVVRKANRRITNVRAKEQSRELVTIPAMNIDADEYAGIESRKIFEKLFHFCAAMNVQAQQLGELRETMVKFLQQALIDEDEGIELQGDEYENSTKHQDEMYAYMEALRALYADRSDAVTGQENLLIRSEMKAFLRDAKEGNGPAPEVMIKLLAEREAKRIKVNEQGSLRGILAEIRALVSALDFQEAAGNARARAELHIATKMLQLTTSLMSSQNKCLTSLEQEIAHFRTSMNARLEYYRALQKISDMVAPYKEEDIGKPINERELQGFEKAEATAQNKCSGLLAKKRYLLHLSDESTAEDTPRICTICQSEFEIGSITSCGHVFCKEDLHLWYAAHGNCPVCKRKLKSADFFDVTYKPSEMTVQAEPAVDSASPSSPTERPAVNSIYSDISQKQLNEIKNIELRGASFGSKVDTICRHLHWLREQDPGSKTIIFSQFREVLDVLSRAFKQNNISHARCDDKNGIQDFKANPAIECFLLHAKAHSAGLNIVVASHVILCEPLINTAIELQAIARVHRIGQHRATTIWMYLIADTVEESIYEISVQRRMAHMKTKETSSRSGTHTPVLLQESAIDAANSRELQDADFSKALAPGKNGGEMVNKEDLWPCLFGSSDRSQSRGDHTFSSQPVDSASASGEIGRFLRAEAAEKRLG